MLRASSGDVYCRLLAVEIVSVSLLSLAARARVSAVRALAQLPQLDGDSARPEKQQVAHGDNRGTYCVP